MLRKITKFHIIVFVIVMITPSAEAQDLIKDMKNWAKRKKIDPTAVEEHYKDVKGGWKMLKWGMTVDEVAVLLKKYENVKRFNAYAVKGLEIPSDPDKVWSLHEFKKFKEVEIKVSSDKFGEFYFYRDRLFARDVDSAMRNYFDDKEIQKAVTTALKKKYPGGKIYSKKIFGGEYEVLSFRYDEQYQKVFTYFRPEVTTIWYLDPKVIKELEDLYNQVEREQRNQQKKKAVDAL